MRFRCVQWCHRDSLAVPENSYQDIITFVSDARLLWIKVVLLPSEQQSGNFCSELTQNNDQLKHKFSLLLDQFQRYVTEQESKSLKDSEHHKVQQESLLSNM